MRGLRRWARAWAIALVLLGAPAHAATLTVLNLDDAGANSLRERLSVAGVGDTIVFAAGLTGSVPLVTPLTILQDVEIAGPGAATITLQGPAADRVLAVNAGTLTLSGLTVAGGTTAGLGGGALVASGATLVARSCVFSDNTANNGGAVSVSSGGSLDVSACTFVDNTTTSVGGGAIINFATATVRNSTFLRNTATLNGGAINTQPSGTTTIVNSTFVDNASGSLGGTIANLGTTTIDSSTFASNEASSGSVIATGNANVSIDNSVLVDNESSGAEGVFSPIGTIPGNNNVFFGNTTNGGANDGNDTGTTNYVIAPSQPLQPLGDYGGPTQTLLPIAGRAAICAGAVAFLPAGIGSDQRGFPRIGTAPNGATCLDAGAVQVTPGVNVPVPGLTGAMVVVLAALLALAGFRRSRRR